MMLESRSRLAPLSVIRKAGEMLWDKGATPLNPWTWVVESTTGTTHLVKEQASGEIICDCPGYQSCGVCSHSTAVVMVIEEGRTGKVR